MSRNSLNMSQLSDHDKAVLNCVFNPNLPLDETNIEGESHLEDVETYEPGTEGTETMELEAVQLAENGKLDEAIGILNKAIELAPQRASLYNNRAHIYQFQKKFQEALNDLNMAIELVQPSQRKTLCKAHCQRAVLHRKANKLELARADFDVAARLGDKFAKSQLVELNPYAALCNQMLQKVMDNLCSD